eukprot:scaffold51059_cov53-Attheya_sp.AAC.1
MAILSNLVPCNSDRLIIYGERHPIVGDLGARVSHVGHGRSRHGQLIVPTPSQHSQRHLLWWGASASWRIEGSGDAVSVRGEFDMVGGC